MSANTIPSFKTLSKAEASCLFSLPSIFTSRPPHQHLSVPHKNVKLHLSYSISLRPKTHFSLTVPFVAQTSDWAQQQDEGEKNNPAATLTELEEEPTWENQESHGFDNEISDSESEVEDGSAEAVRGVGDVEGDEDGRSNGEEGYSLPAEDTRLYVGNLPFDLESERLAMLFEQAGTVEIAEIIFDRQTDTSRGFGFVTMSTVEEAEKAINMFDRYSMDGRRLTVNKAVRRGSGRLSRPPEPGYKAYVGNLPWSVDEARLEEVFSEHGQVLNARVIIEKDTGRSRGFGFVTFSSQNELADAVAALDGQNLDGRPVRVSVAEERGRARF